MEKQGMHHLKWIISGAVSMALMLVCLTGFIVSAAPVPATGQAMPRLVPCRRKYQRKQEIQPVANAKSHCLYFLFIAYFFLHSLLETLPLKPDSPAKFIQSPKPFFGYQPKRMNDIKPVAALFPHRKTARKEIFLLFFYI